tara:strand:+ start:1193 stop:1717 length:525 start_codon:yes stop_codon:yes gene_type:complete
MYLTLKALHVISVISWFAGLVYLGRILIYHREALDKPSLERDPLVLQFKLMESRVYKIICMPAFCLSFLFGGWLAIEYKVYLQSWFHLKLGLVFLLIFYHFYAASLMHKLAQNVSLKSSLFYRLFNEYLTILLIGIVFITITKSIQLTLIITSVMLGLILFVTIFLYRKNTQNK